MKNSKYSFVQFQNSVLEILYTQSTNGLVFTSNVLVLSVNPPWFTTIALMLFLVVTHSIIVFRTWCNIAFKSTLKHFPLHRTILNYNKINLILTHLDRSSISLMWSKTQVFVFIICRRSTHLFLNTVNRDFIEFDALFLTFSIVP